MSSNAEAPISFTTKINGDLFTIRGDDPATFLTRLEAFNMFASVSNFIAQYNGEEPVPAVIANAFPEAKIVPQNTGDAGSPSCSHGPRVYYKGTNKSSGKPYTAWFCSSPDKNDPNKCPPVWV